MATCAFCDIIAGLVPAQILATWHDAIAIRPLDPVLDGYEMWSTVTFTRSMS